MIEVFLILGITIFMGFLALFIFEKTRISQIIVLIGFGFLIGPVMGLVDVSPNSMIISLLPFLSTLALIVLLFDSGLMIDIFSVARAIHKSTIYTFLTFFLSTIAITAIMHLLLRYTILEGVLFGAILGGTCSAIVNLAVEKSKISSEAKSLLTLESTMTDALCIIVAGLVIGLMISNQVPETQTIANMVLSSFSIAILIGTISAISWIYLIGQFELEKYAYMLTLALVFGLFAGVEIVEANGGVAVFIFGMILGNARELSRKFKFRKEVLVNPNIRLFQEEITFFVRTFFFAYIGLLINSAYFKLEIIAISLLIVGIFLIIRKIGQIIVLRGIENPDKNFIVSLVPRGLAAAVLATMPISSGIIVKDFQQTIFAVIIFSNAIATIGIFLFDKEKQGEKIKGEKELEETITEADMSKSNEEKRNKEIDELVVIELDESNQRDSKENQIKS